MRGHRRPTPGDGIAPALPEPPRALGAYVTAVRHGGLLFLSGMLPVRAGQPAIRGRLGLDLSVEQGREAAELAALNALAVAKQAVGSLEQVRLIRLTVHIASMPDFEAHARVADGASELMLRMLGPRGEHVRLALGAASLPGGMPVELEVVLAAES